MIGFLILTVADQRGEIVARFAARHALRDPSIRAVQAAAQGYEVAFVCGPAAEDWPLTARCYTSKYRDDKGRSGSQVWTYQARKLAAADACPQRKHAAPC